jgi:hypothetical protein
VAISKKSWLGVDTEATPGTARLTPTVYHPCKSKFTNKTKYVYLDEERGTRDANYGRVPTVQMASGSLQGPWYNDTSPYFLYGFMGGDTPTQPNATNAPTVYSHALACTDIPPALDLYKSYDVNTYQFAYVVVEKATIKWDADGKLLEADFDVQGQYGTKMSSPPTPSFSGVLPFAGYVPTISINGTTSQDVTEVTLNLTQKTTLFYPSNGQAQFATAYYGERKADLSFSARYDNDTNLYNHFFNNQGAATDALIFTFVGPYLANLWNVGVGAASAGTFTLTFNGQTTAGIAYNATSAAVATALGNLSSVGAANVTVSGTAPNWVVKFTNALAQTPLALTGSGTGLTGGAFSSVAAPLYNQFSTSFPIVGWDEMELDTGKDNVMIKGKGTAMPGLTANSLFTATVQNTIASYLS